MEKPQQHCRDRQRTAHRRGSPRNALLYQQFPAQAPQMLAAVRLHWGIENQLHWVLDMSFGEDQSRIRKDNVPTNAAIIRHAVLNMIRQTPKKRMRVKRMRKAAGWNDSLLTEVLAQVF